MFTDVVSLNREGNFGKILWRDPRRKFAKIKVKFNKPTGFEIYANTKEAGIIKVESNVVLNAKQFYNSDGICEIYCLEKPAIFDVKFGHPLGFKLKDRNYASLEHEFSYLGMIKFTVYNEKAFVKKYCNLVKNGKDVFEEIQNDIRSLCAPNIEPILGVKAKECNYSEDFLHEHGTLEYLDQMIKKTLNKYIDESGLEIIANVSIQLNKMDEFGSQINDAELGAVLREIDKKGRSEEKKDDKKEEPKPEEKKDEKKEEKDPFEYLEFCYNCGKRLDKTKVCNKCGRDGRTHLKEKAIYCVHCGNKLKGKNKFCPDCGQQIF